MGVSVSGRCFYIFTQRKSSKGSARGGKIRQIRAILLARGARVGCKEEAVGLCQGKNTKYTRTEKTVSKREKKIVLARFDSKVCVGVTRLNKLQKVQKLTSNKSGWSNGLKLIERRGRREFKSSCKYKEDGCMKMGEWQFTKTTKTKKRKY